MHRFECSKPDFIRFEKIAIDLIFKGAVFLGDGTELYLVIDLYSIIEQKFVQLKLKF